MIDPENLPVEPEMLVKVLPAGGPIAGQKECKRCPNCKSWGACDDKKEGEENASE